MSDALIVDLARNAILMALALAGPMLLVALSVGLLVSVLQAVTQIQEQTLAFVPKLAGVALVLVITGHWMLGQIIAYTQSLFEMIPHLIAS